MASNTVGAVEYFDFSDHSAMIAASAFIMEYDTTLAAIRRELEQAEEDVRNAQLTDDYDNIEASVQNVRRLNEDLATLNYTNELCQIRIDAKALLGDLKKAAQVAAPGRYAAHNTRAVRRVQEARKAARKATREQMDEDPAAAQLNRELAETVGNEREANQDSWPYEERFFDEISAFDGVFHMVDALRMRLFGGAP